jgi:hypothetical protein
MTDNLNLRVQHIDIAKGISIVLVAMNHSKISDFLPALIDALGLLRMPLFFFLAGIFISSKSSVIAFVTRKCGILLKPYFVTLLISASVALFFPFKDGKFKSDIIGIFYGVGDSISWTSLWFLTHLFVLTIVGYLIIRLYRFEQRSVFANVCFFIGLIALSYLVSNQLTLVKINVFGFDEPIRGLPFSIDLLPFSLIFFLGGYVLRKQVINIELSWAYFVLAGFLFFIICFFTTTDFNLNERIITKPLLVVVAGFLGIYLVLSVSLIMNRNIIMTRICLFFGVASLYILIFHGALLFYVNYYLTRILHHLAIESTQLLNIAIATVTFTLSVSIPPLIKKTKLLDTFLVPTKSVDKSI